MAKTLIVNNTPYEYPTEGDAPGWGADATGWAEAVTEVLSNLQGPNDILETSFSIANNQTTLADVTGLSFNAGSVRSSRINYSIFRISDSNPSGNAESGVIDIVYDNNAGWLIAQGDTVGFAGCIFTITPAGQFRYTSTDIGSLNYIGEMRFYAKSIQQ
jgi:hypothetical protein